MEQNFLENFDFITPFNELVEESKENAKSKKTKHVEQKGRHKINEQINELKHLLPECRYVTTTKASVLECAVNSLRKLQAAKDQLEAANTKLQKENSSLRTEIDKPTDNNGVKKEEESRQGNKTDPANGDSLRSQALSAPELDFSYGSQAVPFNNSGSNINLMGDYQLYRDNPSFSFQFQPSPLVPTGSLSMMNSGDSLPNLRKTLPQSPLSSNSSMQQMMAEANFETLRKSRSITASQDDEDFNTRASKRRLYILLLLLVPLACMIPAHSNDFQANVGAGRVLLGLPTDSIQGLAVSDLFNLSRMAIYCALGIIGAKWTTSSFFWLLETDSPNHSIIFKV